MAVRPMLFSGSMVRALLEGRKTQTRRLLKIPEHLDATHGWADPGFGDGGYLHAPCRAHDDFDAGEIVERVRPKFAVGDVLWVRETWAPNTGSNAIYAADAETSRVLPEFGTLIRTYRVPDNGWKPSIHMPRIASRLTLEVTGVKVERLQDISEEDAVAEGVCQFCEDSDYPGMWDGLSPVDRNTMVRLRYGSVVKAYRCLWETINGADSWEANPWVVAPEFTVRKINVDAYLQSREAA